MKIVALSGGFDPVHVGHLRMFEVLCQKLGIVVVYNIGGGKVQSSSELIDKHVKFQFVKAKK